MVKFLLALGLAGGAAAAMDPDIARGFDHFYNLEFDQSIAVFREVAARQPNAAGVHNHLAQALLFRGMFRAGALETELVTGGNAFLRREKMNPTPEEQREFDAAIATAMRLAQARLDRDPRDQEGLYCLGTAYGLRANYSFLVRKAWMDALRDATTARKLHNRLTEYHPAVIDARMTQGLHDYIVGSLPWTYKVVGFLVGFRGDKETGIRTLKLVHERGENNRYDAGVLLATIYRRERRPAEAVPLLNELIGQFPRNYLLRLELAQMYSDLGDKRRALGEIAEVERLKRANTPGFQTLPVEKILYFRATVQFWYWELDEALGNFQRVTANTAELDLNTGVTAWMRLGQTYDLKGDRSRAIEAYRRAMAYAPGSDRARQAEGYIRTPYQRKRSG